MNAGALKSGKGRGDGGEEFDSGRLLIRVWKVSIQMKWRQITFVHLWFIAWKGWVFQLKKLVGSFICRRTGQGIAQWRRLRCSGRKNQIHINFGIMTDNLCRSCTNHLLCGEQQVKGGRSPHLFLPPHRSIFFLFFQQFSRKKDPFLHFAFVRRKRSGQRTAGPPVNRLQPSASERETESVGVVWYAQVLCAAAFCEIAAFGRRLPRLKQMAMDISRMDILPKSNATRILAGIVKEPTPANQTT